MKQKLFLLLISYFILPTAVSFAQSSALHRDEKCGGVYQNISELNDGLLQQRSVSTPFLSAFFSPKTVKKASEEAIRFMIEVNDPEIVSIKFRPNMNSEWWLTQAGEYREEILLYDDASNGDETAGDRLFTIDQIGYQFRFQVDENNYWAVEERPYERFIIRTVDLVAVYRNGDEVSHEVDLATTLKYIDPDLIPIPAIRNLAPDVYATDYVVNIVKESVGEFPELFPDYEAIAQRYYELYPDDLDYIAIESEYSNTSVSAAAIYTRLRNGIQGTGIGLFDEGASYGSESRLKGLISIFYDNTWPRTFNHEILHQHAVAASFEENFDLGANAGHWGMFEANSSGFLGTSVLSGVLLEIEDLGDSLYQSPRSWNENLISADLLNSWYENGASPEDYYTYNELELYMMGLIPAEEVDSLKTLINWQRIGIWNDQDLRISYDQFKADGIRMFHINEIIETEGTRTPDYKASSKDFRLGLVVASDRPLSALELAYYDFSMREYERETPSLGAEGGPGFTFSQAVNDLASMSTKLQPKAMVSNEPPIGNIKGVELGQNFPNPFQETTIIQFKLPHATQVKLGLYDAQGRHIHSLADAWYREGTHQIRFNGLNLSNGIYYYRLETSDKVLTKRLTLIK